jgi:PPP family 3-phenylpropionic acid transporter
MRKLWPFTFNFLLYACTAFVSPFMVLYYQGLGFTGTQIGLLTGMSPLIVFFSAPLWTGLADATRRHRLLMSLGMLGGVITLSLYPFLKAFVPVVCTAALLNIFVAPITPFADSATLFMLADEKALYGRIRLGGTIGYGLAAAIAGLLVQSYGLRWAFWGSATLFFLGFIVSQKFVYSQVQADHAARGRVRTLLANPRWRLLLTLAFASGAGLAATGSYFFPYMKELGASASTMGLALTVGTVTEVPLLFFANRLLQRFKAYGLLMLAMVVTGLRMCLFALCATPGAVLLIQLLNGLTLPVMWVAAVSYADAHAPPGMKTTAQGLLSAMVEGFGMAVGAMVGGLLLPGIGGRGLYAVFGTAVLAITALVALLHRRLPAEGNI